MGTEKLAQPSRPPTLEEQILTHFGYSEAAMDTPVVSKDGLRTAPGRNFLELYRDEGYRQKTEDLIMGFIDMDPEDSEYESAELYILGFVKEFMPERNTQPATAG